MKASFAKLRRFAPFIAFVALVVAVPLSRRLFPEALPVAKMQALATPHPLPPFAFASASGASITLESFRGRFVLVNVWATWCTPCRQEMPALDKLTTRFEPKDLAVVPISIDAAGISAVRPFYQREGLQHLRIYLDEKSKALSTLAVVGIPTSLLIDRRGREIARLIGPTQWDAPALIKQLTDLIKKHGQITDLGTPRPAAALNARYAKVMRKVLL